MSQILVLGGYGSFGGRISRRLAADGHDILVAGRSIVTAQAFCAGSSRLTAVACDRKMIVEAPTVHRPVLLIDASGPFQGMDHAIAIACIAAGVHYLDIADARDFVCGIGVLDPAAQAAGVAIVSGASSVPALSGAVIRHLSAGMEAVQSIEMAISASNRATAGPAVASAILGQVGRPLSFWSGGRWQKGFGWQSLRRIGFSVTEASPLRKRWVGLVDVPDMGLLPDRIRGRPAVFFRAGTELAFQNLLPWLGSWPVRWGTVTVRVQIGVDGRVLRVESAANDNEAFLTATREWALRHWRFRPATRDGVAATSWKTMRVRFQLTR